MKRLLLISLLIVACQKDDIDEIIVNPPQPPEPPIQNEWFTFSERYSSINETTSYFKSQEYFETYLSKDYLWNTVGFKDGLCYYAPFQKNTAILDFDGDLKPDLLAFASSFCENETYGNSRGRIIFISNYRVSNQKIVINTDHRFGGGRFDVNDFDGDGLSEVLFYATEAKFNMYNEEEDIGGATNFAPMSPTLIDFDNNIIKTRSLGIAADYHTGASGDIDNDGDVDFILWHVPALYNNENIEITPSVAINNGNLNFSVQPINLNDDNWYGSATDLFDINGDGYLDLLVGWRAGSLKWNDLYPNFTNSLSGPVVMFGNGSGNFSQSNSLQLYESFLTSRDISASILGFGFTDYDLDGDIDIIASTTRDEPGGTFEEGTYYDNFYLLLYENNANNFTDVTSMKIDVSFDQSQTFPNMYYVRTVDKNNDGRFDIVPDGIANWGTINYSNNLHWLNIDGNFIKNN